MKTLAKLLGLSSLVFFRKQSLLQLHICSSSIKCLKTGLVLILNTSLGFWMLDFRTFTVDNFYVVIVELIHRLSIKLEMSQQIMKSVAQPRPKSKHVFLNDRLQFQSQTTSIKPNVRNPNDNN